MVGNIDMAPTILDAAGLKIPKHMDGKSLLKIMNKKMQLSKTIKQLFRPGEKNQTHSLSIVSDNYKYLYWFYGEGMEPKEELYNLSKDAFELQNLVSNPNLVKN